MTKLMFVDDEQAVRHAFELTFGDTFDLVITDGAQAALAALAKDPTIGLVVTDLRMGGMGGMALAGEIRSQYPKVRIIVSTAYMSMPSLIQAINDYQLDGYIEKPWQDIDEIRANFLSKLAEFEAGLRVND